MKHVSTRVIIVSVIALATIIISNVPLTPRIDQRIFDIETVTMADAYRVTYNSSGLLTPLSHRSNFEEL